MFFIFGMRSRAPGFLICAGGWDTEVLRLLLIGIECSPPPNSYIEILTLHLTVLRGGA